MSVESHQLTPYFPDIQTLDLSHLPATVPHTEYGDRDIRGRATEEKVAHILKALPFIEEVELAEKNGELDRNMTDIVVFFKPHESGSDIPPVNVQVKSSSREVRQFRWEKMRGIKGEEARQEWLRERRLILLNGDTKVSRSNNRRPIRNEEIIADFTTQLHRIESK